MTNTSIPVRSPIHEANAWGVKDFTEKQELKQKQSFIHFPREEKRWYLLRMRLGLGFISL
jgi:hypothetical protein